VAVDPTTFGGVQQRVIITAAASGIGRVIAAAFVGRGDRVHICDIDQDALSAFRHDFPDVVATHVDMSDADALATWMDAAIADLGGIDVLVNNAGTKGPTAFVEDVTVPEWRACLTVSLDSHFICASKVTSLMKAQGSGSIINMSSAAGLYGYGMRTPYAAAKWAVVGLTKSLAIELGGSNVRCNCICPGSVAGDRMQRVIAEEAAHRGVSTETVEQDYFATQSIRRFVQPQEIADLCLFLASPASAMISGQAIAVDGHTETYHLG
jgi:NAD(P)-dependent dehydrogenase (short-subunit alcohol dehydrogenase family)